MRSAPLRHPYADSCHDVCRLPRDSWARRLFLLGVLALTAGLAAWILWLLESVE